MARKKKLDKLDVYKCRLCGQYFSNEHGAGIESPATTWHYTCLPGATGLGDFAGVIQDFDLWQTGYPAVKKEV